VKQLIAVISLSYVASRQMGQPYLSHLLGREGIQRLHSQDSRLAQPFPQLADGLMHLLLGFAVELVNPGFEVGKSAL
jgi:hypothetical protein